MTSSEAATPDPTRPETTAEHARGLRALGAVAALAAFAWGAYVTTLFRTMEYGWYPPLDGGLRLAVIGYVLAVWLLPVALVLGYRREPRRWLRMVLVLCAASLLFAEAWAGLEEALWRRRAPELAAATTLADPADAPLAYLHVNSLSLETVFQSRWWPYENHALYYDPQTGRFGGHD